MDYVYESLHKDWNTRCVCFHRCPFKNSDLHAHAVHHYISSTYPRPILIPQQLAGLSTAHDSAPSHAINIPHTPLQLSQQQEEGGKERMREADMVWNTQKNWSDEEAEPMVIS